MNPVRLFVSVLLTALALPAAKPAPQGPALKVSVYATAGDVLRYLKMPAARDQAVAAMRVLNITHIFIEGRRGAEYVPPDILTSVRNSLQEQGFTVSGGIATVPGGDFGVRQTGPLGWLNFESPKTQADISKFFSEDAPLFHDIVLDDFFCTADESPESVHARGGRDWGEYRRDLMVSLISPMIVHPARAANRSLQLILKFPQWYDRFQRFGYDPARECPRFNRIWVGTEVRNPKTARMGYVQPTEGYINFRWISSFGGAKVQGAWFDDIECTPQNFVDQAYQSVLAGAPELTFFHLGDVVGSQPGYAVFLDAWPGLTTLAAQIRNRARQGIVFYKPSGSNGDGDLFLADALAMLGLPIEPLGMYPANAQVVILAAQAAADPNLLGKVKQTLAAGGTVVMTPTLLRRLGKEATDLAGVSLAPEGTRGVADGIEVDRGLSATPGIIRLRIGDVPFLTTVSTSGGTLAVWNVRSFSEQDYQESPIGERLLAPKPLGLVELPQRLLDPVRQLLLKPLGVSLEGPAGAGLYLIGADAWLYSFLDQPVTMQWNGQAVELGAHRLLRVPGIAPAAKRR